MDETELSYDFQNVLLDYLRIAFISVALYFLRYNDGECSQLLDVFRRAKKKKQIEETVLRLETTPCCNRLKERRHNHLC